MSQTSDFLIKPIFATESTPVPAFTVQKINARDPGLTLLLSFTLVRIARSRPHPVVPGRWQPRRIFDLCPAVPTFKILTLAARPAMLAAIGIIYPRPRGQQKTMCPYLLSSTSRTLVAKSCIENGF